MTYYRELLLGEGLEKKKEKLVRKLNQGKILLDTYVIILSPNDKNQLEIMDCVLLLPRIKRKEEVFIVGIAKGHEEAIDLVAEFTRQVYDETKGADIRSYILKRQNEGGAGCSI